jgi:hypothetical protein
VATQWLEFFLICVFRYRPMAESQVLSARNALISDSASPKLAGRLAPSLLSVSTLTSLSRMAAIGKPFGIDFSNAAVNKSTSAVITLSGATLNWPPKGDPDYGSRVVSEKSHDVRLCIQLTANVERD